MTTAIAILIYLGFAAYRNRKDAADRTRREVADAITKSEIDKLRTRVTAIEEALLNSPFITYRNN
jgi:cell division protein FtsB